MDFKRKPNCNNDMSNQQRVAEDMLDASACKVTSAGLRRNSCLITAIMMHARPL